MTDLALCKKCAKEKGLFDPRKLTLAEHLFPKELSSELESFIKKMLESTYGNEVEDELISSLPDMLTECPTCHYTLEAYRETGLLGCPECYRAFSPELMPLAVDTPGEKLPPRKAVVAPEYLDSPELERGRLEVLLHEAIKNENYEEAATLRDRIKSLPTPYDKK